MCRTTRMKTRTLSGVGGAWAVGIGRGGWGTGNWSLMIGNWSLAVGYWLLAMGHGSAAAEVPADRETAAIPWTEIGARAGAGYEGDGLAVLATEEGALLRCMFQRLEGDATAQGLWLRTVGSDGRFRVMARTVGRDGAGMAALAETGRVEVEGRQVRWVRAGLAEEYSVSVDGVRQDFVVKERPWGDGVLRVELGVSGARGEKAVHGATVVLEGSGRRIAYSRLRVEDATGRELGARMEVGSEDRVAVLVDDTNAVYPVRIDPTFSDENWISMGGGPGTDGTVNTAVLDTTGNLYIGGGFTVAGDVVANRIAKWDGNSWSALGSGMNSAVLTLAVMGDDLYAGGNFTTAGGVPANRIAKWDGDGWSALGSGMNSNVLALVVMDGELYAGGRFTTAGGAAVNRIAKWEEDRWSALGQGIVGVGLFAGVNALAVMGEDLYAAGQFTMAGGGAANGIARWDGTGWSALGSGINGTVNALAVLGDDLYAGGSFTIVGDGFLTRHVAKWDGSEWTNWGTGLNNTVNALAVSGDDLYAGGPFTTASGGAANNIAKWDESGWSAVGGGMNGVVGALAVSGDDVYAAGAFSAAGGVGANNIAKWDGNDWSELAPGINYYVYALAVLGGDLYAGGEFTTAADGVGSAVTVNRIARWDGAGWFALGEGMNDRVLTLAVLGDDLYAGGWFTTAGGAPANHIARWDGTNWFALEAGVSGPSFPVVTDLAVLDGDLYAAGTFTAAGGVPAYHIAKWDGSDWAALGAGMGSSVSALAVLGGELYAGGSFTTVTNSGGTTVTVNRIARWDGVNWAALGSGMNSAVHTLAVMDGDLYAGGAFTTAGGIAANRIAKWDGDESAWFALADGLTSGGPSLPFVSVLAASGGNLYAGGLFIEVSGVPASYIARWDGGAWSALGSGMNHRVYALAVSGDDLYAGGSFTTAGGKAAAYLALLRPHGDGPSDGPTVVRQPESVTVEAGEEAGFNVVVEGGGPFLYQWRRNGVNIPGVNGPTLTFPSAETAHGGAYTVVIQNDDGLAGSAIATLEVLLPDADARDHFDDRQFLAGDNGQGVARSVNATLEPDEPVHGGITNSASVWATWRPSESGIATVTTAGSDFDTVLAIYTGATLTNLAAVAWDDDSGGFLASSSRFNVTAGVDYQIAVSGFAGGRGRTVLNWNLEITNAALPEIVSHPQSLTVPTGGNVVFDVGAAGGTPLTYQWYRNGEVLVNLTNGVLELASAQASHVGQYFVRMRGADGREVDSRWAALELGENPNVRTENKLENLLTLTNLVQLAGAQGRPRPSRAFSVGMGLPGSQVFSTFGSATQPGERDSARVIGGSSRWFELELEEGGRLVVDTVGSEFDTTLGLYRGRGLMELELVAEDDNGAEDGVRSRVEASVRAGSYLVKVDGKGGAQGVARLNWMLEGEDGPRFVGMPELVDGMVRLEVRGLAGRETVVWASEDLRDWTPVHTAPDGGSFVFEAPVLPGEAWRFYRVEAR